MERPSEVTQVNIADIDKLISTVNQPAESPPPLLGEIDSLISVVDLGVKTEREKIKGLDMGQKRQEAANTTERFTLTTLAEDESQTVRTLSCCNPRTDPLVLKRMAGEGGVFIKWCIANNSAADTETLDLLVESGVPDILQAVSKHKNVSQVTLFKIKEKLTQPPSAE